MKKPLKVIKLILIYSIVSLLLIAIFGSIFGGSIAKNIANRQLPDLLGRRAEVGKVGINLFTGHVGIQHVAVYEEDGITQFAGFDTLDVSVSLLRLLGRTVWVRHFDLVGLTANVWQDSTQFNFSSIIEQMKQSDETKVDEDTTSSPWRVSLHNIRLINGSAHFSDHVCVNPIGFDHLNLNIPDFAFGGKEKYDADLSVTLDGGGVLSANSDYEAGSGDFGLTIALQQFAFEQVRPYIIGAAIDHIGGHLSVEGTVKGNLSHLLNANISALAIVENLVMTNTDKTSVAKLDNLAVKLSHAVVGKQLYEFDNIELNGMELSYELFADSTNTLSHLLANGSNNYTAPTESSANSAVKEQPDTTPRQPLRLRIGQLALHNINLTFADHRMTTDFVFPVTNICINAQNIASSSNSSIHLTANLPQGGRANVDWKGSIENWKENLWLKVGIKNLHLAGLSPYMIEYFAMPFSDGVFSFTSLNTISQNQLDGKNHIDIYKPTLGDKQKAVKPKLHLPVKAALYVLKDKDGKVLIDVPVSGEVDSPDFHYMKTIWKTLGNLIVKVATSPTRLLGGEGSDTNDGFLPIDSAEDDFSSEQLYKIEKLAELAKSDEQITLHFELETPPSPEDQSSTYTQYNNSLERHLTQMGVDEKQFVITAASANHESKAEGYRVTIQYNEQANLNTETQLWD